MAVIMPQFNKLIEANESGFMYASAIPLLAA